MWRDIIVIDDSKPRTADRFFMASRFLVGGSLAVLALAAPAFAQDQSSGVFGLGQIETVVVTGQREAAPVVMSATTVASEPLYTFHDVTLNQALDTMPGVIASNSGGSRNEQLLFVRGFDRLQTPISIDGIRVYLPADNRLDFGRFLTADLSQIEVAQGYVSVLNGPGAMGGAINLVTRKPRSELDIDARSGLTLGNSGSLDSENASVSVGTNQGEYYLQGSWSWNETQRFELSDDYVATASQPAGFRKHSRNRDWTMHLKAGWTPNDSDEYTISYIKEVGAKEAPFSVSDAIASQRDWTWPYWDISSLYFLSNTKLGDTSYVKTRIYWNTFTNLLASFDNANYNSQTLGRAFNSFYDDYSYGGNIEAGTDLFAEDTLKASFFYRRDSHDEVQQIFAPPFTEPHQVSVEDTYSIAAENTFHASETLDVVAGVSYDWRDLLQAQDFVDPTTPTGTGTFINYPLRNGSAINGQAALIWNPAEDTSYYLNVSDRTRFPTLMERFSTRFGTAASNPGLQTERAANYEIGTKQNFGGWHVEASIFYSNISNAIESVILPAPAPAGTTQSQNVGHGIYSGAQAGVNGLLTDGLQLGANVSYIVRRMHIPATNVTPFQLTGVPTWKAFFYANWTVLPELTITPTLDLASNRWENNTAGTIYFKTGAFANLSVSADYRFTDWLDLNLGIKNIADANYQLNGGFPEPGRSYFMELRFAQ
jgi:iron complex outermembrane receptor protein